MDYSCVNEVESTVHYSARQSLMCSERKWPLLPSRLNRFNGFIYIFNDFWYAYVAVSYTIITKITTLIFIHKYSFTSLSTSSFSCVYLSLLYANFCYFALLLRSYEWMSSPTHAPNPFKFINKASTQLVTWLVSEVYCVVSETKDSRKVAYIFCYLRCSTWQVCSMVSYLLDNFILQ